MGFLFTTDTDKLSYFELQVHTLTLTEIQFKDLCKCCIVYLLHRCVITPNIELIFYWAFCAEIKIQFKINFVNILIVYLWVAF